MKDKVSNPIHDNHGRPITYVRLSVTDRCNLRCFYCMPEKGMKFLPKKELLSYEEMERLLSILAELGIVKVRITGGEPFVRKDLASFLANIRKITGIEELHITTNGVLTKPYVEKLSQLGITSVNLSLDTVDRQRFKMLTRRDEFNQVMETFHALLDHNIPTKINAVVIEGKNEQDIIPLAELARNYPVSVRFIEEMPFNGSGGGYQSLQWDYHKILNTLKTRFPEITKIADKPHATAMHYKVPGFKGNLGIIAAYSRTFCGSCNRIRITSQGVLQTCLYDEGTLNIKDFIRTGASDEAIKDLFIGAFGQRAKDGFEAEKKGPASAIHKSMSIIGG
ncbi:GTP 3',8-cyclase MoaA [Fulvivirgaceae bacterium BMA12]|uniref:GTP 3',8-cyclase n=1 Tax=Agaribacillus aureus TaxID=3051825 RepID=A0ABT8LL48_9BACT|nr:GTP 3',8-cyclase MoaA [Fulvivirgaceae bacterium BMA12]